MTKDLSGIPVENLVALHNELVGELNVDRQKVDVIKQIKSEEYVRNNPNFNYLLGRTVGFGIALDGLHAFIVAQSADQAGLLDVDPPYEQKN